MARVKVQYPSNAFKVNGAFIEDTIPGYHTLNVKGKWTLDKELFSAEANVRDGAVATGSRYPAREMEVEYFIEGSGWADLQNKYTQLMQVLDVEDAEIIFNGEADKFIRGSFVIDDDIDTTTITRSGKFKIVCVDPYKYSVAEEGPISAVGGQFSIDYDGTFPTYPKFTVEFPATEDADGDNTETSECGYVGLADARGDVLQFGDPEEEDWADIPYVATTPINQVSFKSIANWSLNSGEVIAGSQLGNVQTNNSGKYAYPSAYGSASGYHGPSITRLTQNETPPIGTDYNFSWKQKFEATKSQFGGVEILLWNNDNGTRTLVSGVQILKTTKDEKCKVYLYVGSTTSLKNYTVKCSKITTGSMVKEGDRITFNVGGKSNGYANPDIGDLVANEVTFHFLKKGTKTAIGSNCIYKCKLTRAPFDAPENVPNTFMPGDVLTINTEDAGVYLNDIPAQDIGALGNDWETFTLNPGNNVIGVEYSDFTTATPTCSITYRKRYL